MTKLPVAILGATGAVGQRFIQLLENHPWFEIQEVVASERSASKTYAEAVNWVLDGSPPKQVAQLVVKALEDELSSPLVFSALPSDVAREVELRLASAGHIVCSNASAHRMAPDVPLVIPEVNAEHIELIDIQRKKRGWTSGALITNSNCTSMPVTMALAPLLIFEPTHLNVVSMQAISGAGYPGVPSYDILDNVIPFIKGEEEKLVTEPAKMLGKLVGDAVLPLPLIASAACNRVPVVDGHLVNIAVTLAKRPSLDEIKAVWQNYTGSSIVRQLPSAPKHPVI
ncbi:MAG: aspartate-semialdehyde dehydrogenase, partial [Phototrophicales bacterium]